MTLIKTILAFALTIFALVFLLIIGLPAFILSFLGLRKPMSWAIYLAARSWARLLIALTGCTLKVEGKENIPSGEGICFVSNHVGVFDVVLALAHIGRPFGFIAKKELLYIPMLNFWIHILGGLFIDRKNIRKALKTINLGIERIRKGGNMIIFPEGTRSKGRGLLPFRSGAMKLATQSLAPIVPIAISGSYEVFEKNYLVQAAAVRMVFCPPIIIADMSSDDRRLHLVNQVRETIEGALNREQSAGIRDSGKSGPIPSR